MATVDDVIEFNIKSNVVSSEAIRRFKRSIHIGELKNQLELITGAQSQSMKIHVHDERGTKLFDLDDDARVLDSYNVHSKMILQVEETNLKQANMFEDTTDVPKYELTPEEYAARKNTAKQFLLEHKIGKYNPAAQEEHARKEKEKEQHEQESANKIHVNDRCEVMVPSQPTKRGTVMYKGDVHFKPGVWIGIRYDEPLGKNNGSVEGKKYFECVDKYGAFVRPSAVTVGDFPEVDLEEL
ncbi:unnamed protein product [Rotaria socialis]|uniref:CAP-Gly domain-containing protein n=1 Tax=Rotaria socialis TaxID=392032 RepID=A0A817YQ66_9BILA|nr:unnamed protein product [Rotaria socialis]CAF3320616.1 unnamed protein product [Rotaria socialis]CAF3356618.1 unnamed protein product [Rotaria socialis]CAF3381360.1 unnamed protein product [Rotaria socialis]CAF3564696.1 unnamed protein product [Rotaria socialis]